MEEKLEFNIKSRAENVNDYVIEKRGHVITFTLAECETNKLALEKKVKELLARREVSIAKMQNVVENHPEIPMMEGIKRAACAVFFEAENEVKDAEETIKAIQDAIDEQDKEVAIIKAYIENETNKGAN